MSTDHRTIYKLRCYYSRQTMYYGIFRIPAECTGARDHCTQHEDTKVVPNTTELSY